MLVSVIVPTYNRSDLISRCFESVVHQKHRPIEFILADDASTDQTENIAAQLLSEAGVRVRYLKLPFNQGVSAARNAAARLAEGKIIAFLDSDDVWFDNHLDKLLKVQRETEADVVYSRGDIRESPDSLPSGRSSFGPNKYEETHLSECLYYYNFVLPSATIVRREFFDIVGYFDESPDIQHAEDWDIFLRAASSGLRFLHVNEVTTYYTTPKNISEAKTQMMMRRAIVCLEKHKDYHFVNETNRRATVAYYRLWLGIKVGRESLEAKMLFSKVLNDSNWTSLEWWVGLLGRINLTLPRPLMNVGMRCLYKVFRLVRARHRQLRGFKEILD